MEAWTNAQLLEIYGWVKRIETAARKMKDDNGEVSIKDGERLNLIKETDISRVIEGKHVVSIVAVSRCILCETYEKGITCTFALRERIFYFVIKVPYARKVYSYINITM